MGLGFRGWSSECRVKGSGFKRYGLGCRDQGSGFRHKVAKRGDCRVARTHSFRRGEGRGKRMDAPVGHGPASALYPMCMLMNSPEAVWGWPPRCHKPRSTSPSLPGCACSAHASATITPSFCRPDAPTTTPASCPCLSFSLVHPLTLEVAPAGQRTHHTVPPPSPAPWPRAALFPAPLTTKRVPLRTLIGTDLTTLRPNKEP